MMSILTSVSIILVSSFVIYFIGEIFANASSRIGDYLKLPRSVKGATFDAVASSLPELFVVLFSVIFFMEFEVGIGTIAGSALFNLLVIPGICVLLSPVVFEVGKKVISRDALFYIISVFVLLVLLIYFKTWGIIIAIILLVIYAFYLKEIIKHSKETMKFKKQKKDGINLPREIIKALTTMIIIGTSTYFLTKSSIDLAYLLKIPTIIIAFTITAAATSVPDAVISIINAKKGRIDDSASNVFGSNIFDISIGLGIPLLIYSLAKGPVEIVFDNLEIILGLLGSTIIVLYLLLQDSKLTKKEGIILLIIYLFFFIYIILLSLNLF
ncbi:hypothetical protein GF386_03845 [Candidatus Pacearchaeota archaeon]|nr:hypothetical protein [Candidatus Pacearchaeota archaeon]MBD3283279.1 hypothetical protein [Candidatus Pacearchaeota archaeon]